MKIYSTKSGDALLISINKSDSHMDNSGRNTEPDEMVT